MWFAFADLNWCCILNRFDLCRSGFDLISIEFDWLHSDLIFSLVFNWFDLVDLIWFDLRGVEFHWISTWFEMLWLHSFAFGVFGSRSIWFDSFDINCRKLISFCFILLSTHFDPITFHLISFDLSRCRVGSLSFDMTWWVSELKWFVWISV